VSRAPQNLRIVPASVRAGIAGLVAVLAVAGCSAGQDSQTDTAEPAVNGSLGQVGPIMIRDAQFAFPHGGIYPAGGEASLVLTIINTGTADDELVEVTSSVADDVEVTGDRRLIAGRALQIGTPGKEAGGTPSSVVVTTQTPSSPTSVSGAPSSVPSSAPSSSSSPSSAAAPPGEIGKATVVLGGLSSALNLGKTYPVTFVFRGAGSITLDLPIAAPTTPRPEPTGESHG
jgi:copper(I)-binding protein